MTTPTLPARVRAGLLLAAFLAAAPRVAPSQPNLHVDAEPQPSPRYLEVVDLYAKGDRAEALARLAGWSEDDLRVEQEAMRTWERWARLGGEGPRWAAFRRLPLRAVVMLHTDAAASTTPVGEGWEPSCGRGPHDVLAEYAADLVRRQPGTAEHPPVDFVRRWYVARATAALRVLCLADAERWSLSGLKLFARDPDLLTILATNEEILGSQPLRAPVLSTSRQVGQALATRSERQAHLGQARRRLEEALAADPGRVEARLRLGRVQWRLGQPDAARASLKAALAANGDSAVRYLAHLFLGRVEEDARRLPDAAREYQAALAEEPRAQAAGVALANALALAGESARAGGALLAAVRQAPRPDYEDPYWIYFMGPWDRATAMLDALREESRP